MTLGKTWDFEVLQKSHRNSEIALAFSSLPSHNNCALEQSEFGIIPPSILRVGWLFDSVVVKRYWKVNFL